MQINIQELSNLINHYKGHKTNEKIILKIIDQGHISIKISDIKKTYIKYIKCTIYQILNTKFVKNLKEIE